MDFVVAIHSVVKDIFGTGDGNKNNKEQIIWIGVINIICSKSCVPLCMVYRFCDDITPRILC